MYLEPWHSDVFDFLELKKNTGKEEQRARDLFFALWIPDLFMKRVETNQVSGGRIKELSCVSFTPETWRLQTPHCVINVCRTGL